MMMDNLKTQEGRLDYLLRKFKEDSVQYRDLEVQNDYENKRMALRSLMNIRMPKSMSGDVLTVQDAFLKKEAEEKGIVTLKDIRTVGSSMEAVIRLQIESPSGRVILQGFR